MDEETVVWELIKNGEEILATLEQDAEDLRVNGGRYMLGEIIPKEHIEAVRGLLYHVGDDWYLVRCRPVDDWYLTPDYDNGEEAD